MTAAATITIICDDREQNGAISFMEGLIDKSEIPMNLVVRRITIGDYAITVNGRLSVVFERKTWADLAASIKDGRMHTQQAALLELVATGVKVFYIIEGRDYQDEKAEIAHMTFKQLHAKLRHNMLRGLPFIQTRTAEKTAALLVQFGGDCFALNKRGELTTVTPDAEKIAATAAVEKAILEAAVADAADKAAVPAILTDQRPKQHIDIMISVWEAVGVSNSVANILVTAGITVPEILRQEDRDPLYWKQKIANLQRPTGRLLGEAVAEKAIIILQGAYGQPDMRDIILEGKIYGALPKISPEKGALIAKNMPLAAICRREFSDLEIMRINTVNGKKLIGEKLANDMLSYLC